MGGADIGSGVEVGAKVGEFIGAIASVAISTIVAVGDGESFLANKVMPATVTIAIIPTTPNPTTAQSRNRRGFGLSDVINFDLDKP